MPFSILYKECVGIERLLVYFLEGYLEELFMFILYHGAIASANLFLAGELSRGLQSFRHIFFYISSTML